MKNAPGAARDGRPTQDDGPLPSWAPRPGRCAQALAATAMKMDDDTPEVFYRQLAPATR
jgi:hypothetical protein